MSDFNVRNLFDSKLANCNLDRRFEKMTGVRIAGWRDIPQQGVVPAG